MSKLKEKYLARFDELIAEGEKIGKTKETRKRYLNVPENSSTITIVNSTMFKSWKTKIISLFENIVSKDSQHYQEIKRIYDQKSMYDNFEYILSLLAALKEDYEQGYLDDLSIQIEAELSGDYMEQAEALIVEANVDKSYIPAAVLAGAVLEKTLRSLCERQKPPIETQKQNGKNITLTPLIHELKKAGVYNELKAKQLRGWADIRNAAAHGEFDKFNKDDVESMIKGINNFLADYVG